MSESTANNGVPNVGAGEIKEDEGQQEFKAAFDSVVADLGADEMYDRLCAQWAAEYTENPNLFTDPVHEAARANLCRLLHKPMPEFQALPGPAAGGQ